MTVVFYDCIKFAANHGNISFINSGSEIKSSIDDEISRNSGEYHEAKE